LEHVCGRHTHNGLRYLALLLLLLLQGLDAEPAGHEGDSSDGDGQAPNLLPLIKEIWSR
jgi:hypothetical protein